MSLDIATTKLLISDSLVVKQDHGVIEVDNSVNPINIHLPIIKCKKNREVANSILVINKLPGRQPVTLIGDNTLVNENDIVVLDPSKTRFIVVNVDKRWLVSLEAEKYLQSQR